MRNKVRIYESLHITQSENRINARSKKQLANKEQLTEMGGYSFVVFNNQYRLEHAMTRGKII